MELFRGMRTSSATLMKDYHTTTQQALNDVMQAIRDAATEETLAATGAPEAFRSILEQATTAFQTGLQTQIDSAQVVLTNYNNGTYLKNVKPPGSGREKPAEVGHHRRNLSDGLDEVLDFAIDPNLLQ